MSQHPNCRNPPRAPICLTPSDRYLPRWPPSAIRALRTQNHNLNPFDPQAQFGDGIIGQFDNSRRHSANRRPSPRDSRPPRPTSRRSCMITAQDRRGSCTPIRSRNRPADRSRRRSSSSRRPTIACSRRSAPSPPRKSHVETEVYKGVRIEEHEGRSPGMRRSKSRPASIRRSLRFAARSTCKFAKQAARAFR